MQNVQRETTAFGFNDSGVAAHFFTYASVLSKILAANLADRRLNFASRLSDPRSLLLLSLLRLPLAIFVFLCSSIPLSCLVSPSHLILGVAGLFSSATLMKLAKSQFASVTLVRLF